MFRYYIKLGVLSIRSNPALSALMVAAIAIGIGACMTVVTVQHMMGSNPIPEKSAVLRHVQDTGSRLVLDHGAPVRGQLAQCEVRVADFQQRQIRVTRLAHRRRDGTALARLLQVVVTVVARSAQRHEQAAGGQVAGVRADGADDERVVDRAERGVLLVEQAGLALRGAVDAGVGFDATDDGGVGVGEAGADEHGGEQGDVVDGHGQASSAKQSVHIAPGHGL